MPSERMTSTKKRFDHNKLILNDTIAGYCKLVEAVIISAIEKATVPKSWKTKKKASKRMLEKKAEELKDIEKWLGSNSSENWFNMYEIATGVDRSRIKARFYEVFNESKKIIEELSTAGT